MSRFAITSDIGLCGLTINFYIFDEKSDLATRLTMQEALELQATLQRALDNAKCIDTIINPTPSSPSAPTPSSPSAPTPSSPSAPTPSSPKAFIGDPAKQAPNSHLATSNYTTSSDHEVGEPVKSQGATS